MSEAKVNEALDKRAERFERSQLPQHVRALSRSIGNTRLQVNDLLAEHANNDGTISKARLNALVRRLESIEQSIRTESEQAMRQSLRASAEYGAVNTNAALISGIGAVALAAIVGASTAALVDQARQALADVLAGGAQLLAIGLVAATIARRTLDFIFGNVGPDGKTLTDRLWQLAGDLRSALSNVIRRDVLQGRKLGAIQRSVKEAYEREDWKTARLIETEALTAYRTATAIAAEKSPAVKAVKIVDYPDHARHERHKCYEYAKANEHGMGRGVYPPNTVKIRQPHPQCRATLHVVLGGAS